MARHYISMLKNISRTPSIWMVWLFNHYIISLNFNAIFPCGMIFTMSPIEKAFSRAKMQWVFLNSTWPFPEFFSTLKTFFSNSFLSRQVVASLGAIFLSTNCYFFMAFIAFHDVYHNILIGSV